MYKNDAYYDAPYDDQAEHEEMQERIDYEMKNDNYPYSADNINQAMQDDGLIKCLDTLSTLLSQGKTSEAGLVLSSTLYTYWEERTTREVEENF